MTEPFSSMAEYEENHQALLDTLRRYVEGTVLHNDIESTLAVVHERVVGTGMGEQGHYIDKQGLRDKFYAMTKKEAAEIKHAVDYPNTQIIFFTRELATLSAEVSITALLGGESKTNTIIQMATAIKEQGRWQWVTISVAPLILTKEGIAAMPLTFAENALAQLKAELQEDTFDLMNQSFSVGILVTYNTEGYPLYFANNSMIAILGYQRADFEARFRNGVVRLNHPDEQREMEDFFQRGARSREDFGSRARWRKKDGDYVWVEFRTRATQDELGNDILLTVVMDVTEMVALQEATRKQHQTIVSSMRYASKIQRSMLPREELFREAFADYAIRWSPRDIVGGDVFWIKRFAAGTILCVCDCTGHGMPGALLSTLVVSVFESSIDEANCQNPDQVLRRLDVQLSQLLGSGGSAPAEKPAGILDLRDGCDLAVLFIAPNGSVTISSAKMHVFICDGRQVRRIKGQPLRIGEGRRRREPAPVAVTEIPPNPANKYYIASDGLFDQVGGGSAKRPFGYEEFRRLLLETHEGSQDVAAEKIWEAFENYRGEEPRRDDVELIAFQPKTE